MKAKTIIWVAVCVVTLLAATAVSGSDSQAPQKAAVTALSDNNIEDVIFPAPDIMISIDYAGLVDVTAKLEAYSISGGQRLWTQEAKVGRKFQLLNDRIFYDDEAGLFYIGNGPVTAIESATGTVKWVIDFKETGVVRWIRAGANNLLLLGSGTDKKVDDYDGLKKHFEQPLLICVRKDDGGRLWEYKIEKAEDLGDIHILLCPDDQGEMMLSPDYTKGFHIIKGKRLYCIENGSGREIWSTEKSAYGAPLLRNDVVYANVDKKISAYQIKDGSVKWQCDKKVEKTSSLIPAAADILIAINAGEFKDGRNQGGYKLHAINAETGQYVWAFDKGSDFNEIESINENRIYIAEKDNNRIVQLDNGKEIGKKSRKGEYAMGSWILSDKIIDIGKGGLLCRNLDRSEVKWEGKYNRAKHGKGFMMGLLKGLSAVMQAASSSLDQQQRDVHHQQQKQMEKKQLDKRQEAFNPQKRGRFESELWNRPYNRDAEFGTAAYIGNLLIFPDHNKRVIGVSAENGALEWQVDTKEADPWPYFTPDQSTMVVADGKQLHIVKLEE